MADHLVDDIAAHGQTNSLGTVGTDLFKSNLPATPDGATALFQYEGDPTSDSFSGVQSENPRLQIQNRAATRATAEQKAYDWLNLLNLKGNLTVNGKAYRWIKAMHSPAFLKIDENNRFVFVTNYTVKKVI